MIQKIWTLEEVLENIEPFSTKEEIVSEIKSMLKETEEELTRQTYNYLKESLEDETLTLEEKEEIRENLEIMEQNMTE